MRCPQKGQYNSAGLHREAKGLLRTEQPQEKPDHGKAHPVQAREEQAATGACRGKGGSRRQVGTVRGQPARAPDPRQGSRPAKGESTRLVGGDTGQHNQAIPLARRRSPRSGTVDGPTQQPGHK